MSAAATAWAPMQLTMRQKVLAFATMCVGMFIALLDIQIVSASLRDIGGGLSAGADETVWVQTAYLIAEIIVIPMSGWLACVMSTRWLFAASALGFTIASMLCGLAWNIESMIADALPGGQAPAGRTQGAGADAVRRLARRDARPRAVDPLTPAPH